MPAYQGTTKGFKRSGALLSKNIRRLSEARGFAVSRVLTHWAEIVGEDIATVSRPVEISYGHKGMGATLVVLTTGAQAPMLEMQKEQIRERVNATYGYNAIARVRLTQTAATGFAEGQVAFDTKPKERKLAPANPAHQAAAKEMTAKVENDALKDALDRLGQNILNKSNS